MVVNSFMMAIASVCCTPHLLEAEQLNSTVFVVCRRNSNMHVYTHMQSWTTAYSIFSRIPHALELLVDYES